ncbi:hypothetical protein ZWY2020_043319 [Hordeum vulgare]|nr:hypothetical protein ZWY2020_043319 [Hordeum vulgare]
MGIAGTRRRPATAALASQGLSYYLSPAGRGDPAASGRWKRSGRGRKAENYRKRPVRYGGRQPQASIIGAVDARFPEGIGWGGGWTAGGKWWGFGFSRKWTCGKSAGARVARCGRGDLEFGQWRRDD